MHPTNACLKITLMGLNLIQPSVCKKKTKKTQAYCTLYKHTSAFSSLAEDVNVGKLNRNSAKCVTIPFEVMRYRSIFVTYSIQSSLLRFGSGGSAEQRTRVQVPSGSTSANFVDVSS